MAGGELHESEERFRQAFEHSGIGMAIVGLDGRFLRVNHRLCEIVGYAEADLLARDFQSITHPDDLAADLEQARRLHAGEIQSYELEKRYRHHAGHWVWILLTGAIVRDRAGQPIYFLAQLQDISARKEAARRQAWYREVTRQFPNGAIIVFDRDLRYVLADGSGLAEVGLSRQMLEGQTIFDLFPRETCAILEPPYRAAFEGQHSVFDVPFADRIYQLHVLPVRDDSGDIVAGLAMTQDLTARVRVERQLAASLAEKEVLLKEVHHRVKNNLQIVSSLLSLQAAHLADDVARAALRETQARVRSVALVHEKLYMARDLARVDLLAYVRDLVATIVRPQARAATPVQVSGDRLAVTVDVAVPCGLIVNELLANALKYAYPGERHGPVDVVVTAAGDEVALAVADQGVGLPAGFDPRQVRSLGMHLVLALTRQLGGGFEVESAGEGARFTVRFRVGGREPGGMLDEAAGATGEVGT